MNRAGVWVKRIFHIPRHRVPLVAFFALIFDPLLQWTWGLWGVVLGTVIMWLSLDAVDQRQRRRERGEE